MIANSSLFKIGAVGAVACLGMITAVTLNSQRNVKKKEFYKNAMQILRKHEGAMSLLGEPITEGFFAVREVEKVDDETRSQVSIFVNGTKDKGQLFIWVARRDEKEPQIQRIELQLNSDNSRRLVVKSH